MLTIPSEIRNLLKSDSVNKNFRVHFPNGERADITNDNIVDDSITFGESICSSEQLQFGLCETPTLEFETVGVENIKGAVIECSMEVEYTNYKENVYKLSRPYPSENTSTISGVNFLVNEDGSVTMRGTATSSINYYLSDASVENNFSSGIYFLEADGLQSGIKLNDCGLEVQKSIFKFTQDSSHLSPTIKISIQSNTAVDTTIFWSIKKINTEDSVDGDNLIILPYSSSSGDRGGINYSIDESGKCTCNRISNNYSIFTFKYHYTIKESGIYYFDGYTDNVNHLGIGGGTDSFRISTNSGVCKYIYMPENAVIDITQYFDETSSVENIVFTPFLRKLEKVRFETTELPEGVVFKPDLDDPVYSIPYGTFIVDSCKKQSDMSHRRITTYNTFAYKNWELSEQSKTIMSKYFYWYQNGLKASIEGLTKLLFPRINEEYVELTNPKSTTKVTKFIEILDDRYQRIELYSVYFYVNRYSFDIWHSIYNFKYECDNYYLNIADQIKKAVDQIVSENDHIRIAYQNAGDNGEIDEIFEDMIGCRHYTNNRHDYNLYTNHTYQGSVYVQTCEEFYESNHYIFGYLSKTTNPDWETATETLWYTMQSDMYIPSRIVLSHKYQNQEEEILYDTDPNHSPIGYVDENSFDVDLFDSPSGIYIPLNCIKKNVQMTKSVIDGGSSTVSYPLYRYDWATIATSDLKEVFQSYLELQGKFGLVKRDGNIDFISVNEAFNTPDETIPKSEYETIWYDDYMSKPYGRISASFTNENNESAYTYLDIVEDFSEEKYKTYDISNNFFIKNYSRTEEDIQLIFTAMSLNMKDISYMPMQITMKGRPDLEAGDVILIESDDQEDPIVGFMMQRRLTGVNSLRDEISSQDEISSETASSLKATYDEDTETLTLYTADTRR